MATFTPNVQARRGASKRRKVQTVDEIEAHESHEDHQPDLSSEQADLHATEDGTHHGAGIHLHHTESAILTETGASRSSHRYQHAPEPSNLLALVCRNPLIGCSLDRVFDKTKNSSSIFSNSPSKYIYIYIYILSIKDDKGAHYST